MGMYLNPGNSGFSSIRNDVYVDKSGLIQLVNETMETPRRLVCVSRPRRFGKSFAAKMLCAYYDKTCDSASLFEDLKITSDSGAYEKHLNKYDVIYLDLASVMEEAEEMELVPFIKQELVRELSPAYPQLNPKGSFFERIAGRGSCWWELHMTRMLRQGSGSTAVSLKLCKTALPIVNSMKRKSGSIYKDQRDEIV